MKYLRRSRSENWNGPRNSAQAAARPCGNSHHWNGAICAHSGLDLSNRKLSTVRRTVTYIAAMAVKSKVLGRGIGKPRDGDGEISTVMKRSFQMRFESPSL